MKICDLLVKLMLFNNIFLFLFIISLIPLVIRIVRNLIAPYDGVSIIEGKYLILSISAGLFLLLFLGLVFIYAFLTPARGACHDEYIRIIYNWLGIIY